MEEHIKINKHLMKVIECMEKYNISKFHTDLTSKKYTYIIIIEELK